METVAVVLNVARERVDDVEAWFRESELPVWSEQLAEAGR